MTAVKERGFGLVHGNGCSNCMSIFLQMEKVLLTHWFASMTRSQINDERTSNDTRYYGIKTAQKLQKHGTSHISIIDRFGNAAAITTTINTMYV